MTKERRWIEPVTVTLRSAQVMRAPALIDTGSTISIIEDRLAAEADLHRTGVLVDLYHGRIPIVEGAAVHLGKVTLERYPFCDALLQFATVSEQALPEDVRVVLGMDFLEQVEAQADFKGRLMDCGNPTAQRHDIGAYEGRFRRLKAYF